MEFFNYIPQEIINFLLVALFSLLIGLEQRRHHSEEKGAQLFGTDRTFTFIGILGYVLFLADTTLHLPFIAGLVVLGGLLAVSYFNKVTTQYKHGLTSIVLALLTYCLPIMVINQPVWLSLMFVVIILVITELKDNFINLSKKISGNEFITLAKFIVFAGIILPLLPHTDISPQIKISPYKVWLAVVVIAGISYLSYLLKKYIFPRSGLLLSALLGGLYSSTATTIIVAKREKRENIGRQAISALMLTNGMMYLRILVLATLLNKTILQALFVPVLILFTTTFLLAWLLGDLKIHDEATDIKENQDTIAAQNPLEFKTAIIFGILFVFFAILTQYVFGKYGESGITLLAFVSGVTDVDPFVITFLQEDTGVAVSTAVLAIINATNSNNMLKTVFALSLCSTPLRKRAIIAYSILVTTGLLVSIVFYLVNK